MPDTPPLLTENATDRIPLQRRLLLLAAAWAVALFAAGFPDSLRLFSGSIEAIFAAVLFPLGVTLFLAYGLPESHGDGVALLIGGCAGGWLLYLALTAGTAVASKRAAYLWLYALLSVLLLTNVVGCHILRQDCRRPLGGRICLSPEFPGARRATPEATWSAKPFLKVAKSRRFSAPLPLPPGRPETRLAD